jgi:hypothetical protein
MSLFNRKNNNQQPINTTVSSKACPWCHGEEHTGNGVCGQALHQNSKELARSQKSLGMKVTGKPRKGN